MMDKITEKKASLWKKSDIFILIIWLFIAGILFLIFIQGKKNDSDGLRLEVTVGDRLYGSYDLKEDMTINIGESNTCRIENGKVSMISAGCPDKICLHHKEISSSGETIVCLPNNVILRITGGDGNEGGLDAVTQ